MNLTPRQTQAIELASLGLSVSEISEALGVSVRTVEQHLADARKALGAKNTTHAVACAFRSGLLHCVLLVICFNALTLNYSMDMRRPVRTRINTVHRVARNMQIRTGRQKA